MSDLPGVGVMIKTLFAKDDSDALDPYYGREIAAIKLDKSAYPDGVLFLRFTDGAGVKIYDDGRSCCEERYMHTDDELGDFIGATLLGAEIKSAPTQQGDWETHEMQFLHVTTSKGIFTVETHNKHNGYYGGFWMTVASDDACTEA